MRGCFALLVEYSDDQPTGNVQIVDWFSRKEPHVCRSTFAAELHAALDGLNQGMLIQTAIHEMLHGARSASELLKLRETGGIRPVLELCIDARAVFDAVTAGAVKVPADKHLFLHLLKLREMIRRISVLSNLVGSIRA